MAWEDDQEFKNWLIRYAAKVGHYVEAMAYQLYDAWLAGKGNR